MARRTDQPLSVAEAKTRLRRTTEEALPTGYIRRHPCAGLAAAFAAGYVAGRVPGASALVTRSLLKSFRSFS